MRTQSLIRFLHTVRHLRPIQIGNRIHRKFLSAVPSQSAPPELRSTLDLWTPPIERPRQLVDSETIQVFQTEIRLSENVWNDPNLSSLVLYNLHYFDDLNARDAHQRLDWHREMITSWIKQNPVGVGTGWEPYPLSLRIVNWIKWSLSGNRLEQPQVDSLAFQTRSLNKQIEFHLMGNHVWANAKALIFAGMYFSGPEADQWLKRGIRLLRKEIDEQVLSDGGHFELSPMYQCILLEDLLDIVNLTRAFGSESMCNLEPTIERMRYWLRVMCHPDGDISFFNDAAFGIAAKPMQIDDYACRLNLPTVSTPSGKVVHLAESGYIRVQFPSHCMLIDVAQAGATYQPGHSHADTLSFEWSLSGIRAIVNSGTSCYGVSNERLRQRGSAAHNTVVVDQTDSSEVWSGFRLARRAHPFDLTIDEQGGAVVISCSHDGYQRLANKVTHARRWEIRADGFAVFDKVFPRFQSAVSRMHVHPMWSIHDTPSGGITAESRFIDTKITFSTADGHRIVPATFHPEFEVSQPNAVIECELKPGIEGSVHVRWT